MTEATSKLINRMLGRRGQQPKDAPADPPKADQPETPPRRDGRYRTRRLKADDS